jgi:DsbC/DsbD-like thiol-disulfide interchange protein
MLATALLGWSCLLPPAARAASSPWASNPQSQVRLISAWRVAPRQGELRLGLHFRLARGWHVYWKNSGDAGYAPVVAFTRQAGLSYPQLLWPAPHRYELPGGLEAFGYDTEVVYPIHAMFSSGSGGGPGGAESSGSARGGSGGRGAATAAGGTLRLGADVDYLVCEVDCVPHRYSLELDQPVGDAGAADPETAPLLDRWWQQLPAAAGQLAGVRIAAAIAPLPPDGTGRTGAEAGEGELRLTFELQGVTAAPGGADLFFETDPALGLGRPRVRASAGGLVFEVPVRRQDRSAPLPAAAVLAWTATGLVRGGAPLSLAGRLEAPIRTPAAESTMAGRGATGTSPSGAAVPTATAAPAGPSAGPATPVAPAAPIAPAGTLTAILAAGDPRLVVPLAAAAALAALDLWGLLRRRPAAARAIRREALGFVALLLVLALLYTLSLEVRPESLAAVELALLGMGLAAWLWRRYRLRRPPAQEPAGPRPAPS